jgi:hypothetical protein
VGAFELHRYQCLQRAFDPLAQILIAAAAHDRMQPLITAAQQLDQQRGKAIEVIAQMLNQRFNMTRGVAALP